MYCLIDDGHEWRKTKLEIMQCPHYYCWTIWTTGYRPTDVSKAITKAGNLV